MTYFMMHFNQTYGPYGHIRTSMQEQDTGKHKNVIENYAQHDITRNSRGREVFMKHHLNRNHSGHREQQPAMSVPRRIERKCQTKCDKNNGVSRIPHRNHHETTRVSFRLDVSELHNMSIIECQSRFLDSQDVADKLLPKIS